MSRSSSVSGCANDPREAGRESDVGIGRHERKREIQQSDLKRKAQDEAFEAWTKEKDRLSRARRREVTLHPAIGPVDFLETEPNL